MALLTAFAQKKLGDIALGIADWTMPSTWLTILSASPGESGSLTSEFTGGSFARQALTAAMSVANATTGISSNTSAITFPANTATHGMALYAAIVDSATLGAGNVLAYATIGNPRVINNGDPAIVIDIGAISVSIVGTEAIMISGYLMKKLVDHMLGKASYSKPTVYLGLFDGAPVEVGVGGYLRQLLTGSMSAVDASAGTSTNTADILFPTPTADYPDVSLSIAVDAASGGNALFVSQLPSTLSIRAAAAPALFPAGSINFKIT